MPAEKTAMIEMSRNPNHGVKRRDEMSKDDQLQQLLRDLARQCPQCHSTETTHAFHHVSDPVGRDDGTYAVCEECKVYWPFITKWLNPEFIARDIGTARRISDTVREHCRLVDPPPYLDDLRASLNGDIAARKKNQTGLSRCRRLVQSVNAALT
jgi:hypothetical protein